MKKLLLLLLLPLSMLANAKEQYFLFCYFIGNGKDGLHFAGSTDGLNWEAFNEGKSYLVPSVGQDKLMRDPCIYQGPDGVYRMVWTSGWWDKIIGYASSKDLINWSEQKAIPVMAHEDSAKNSWAPEISYDDKTKSYFIFWATTIPNRHSPIAYTDREKGLNHRIYCTSTKDFEMFSPTTMFYNTDFSAIDATILKRNKKFYMFVKNENPNPPQKNIRITTSEWAMGPYPTTVSEPITGNYWAEGPTSIEVGDSVYVYFDKYRNHAYGAVRSKDMEHWDDVSSVLKMPKGIRHGTAFQVSKEVFDKVKKHYLPTPPLGL